MILRIFRPCDKIDFPPTRPVYPTNSFLSMFLQAYCPPIYVLVYPIYNHQIKFSKPVSRTFATKLHQGWGFVHAHRTETALLVSEYHVRGCVTYVQVKGQSKVSIRI